MATPTELVGQTISHLIDAPEGVWSRLTPEQLSIQV
jgi:hypothetical protein